MPGSTEPAAVNEGEELGTVVVLEQPAVETAVAAIETALDRGHLVSIAGRCTDAGGGLPAGRRHVLVKPDGHVAVHGRVGDEPDRRWTAVEGLRVSDVDGEVVVEPAAGEEDWQLSLESVDSVTTFAAAEMPGGSGERVTAGHAALRDRVLAQPDVVEPGFEPRATERQTPAGPVDLYGRDAAGRAVVVEIKAHRAGPAAVGQLDRYVVALSADLHVDAEVRGILVAPSATERTRELLDRRGYGFSRLALDE